jgi:PilZ domain
MSVSDEEFWQSQRRYKRAKVLWPATLVADAEHLDCIILDLSANGARIRVAGGVPMPISEVVLEIPRFGAFSATAAWNSETELGLRFAEDPIRVAELLGDTLPSVRTIVAPEAAD